MDNVCHTLVGVAAARAGLNRTTRLATATLALSANLPDIDALAFATGVPAVALRRGWTHGVLAQAVLPVAFAALMWALARRRRAGVPDANFGWLLLLSYVGVLSHVFLDYLNTYGVRLLTPLSNRWFYGDAVFIVDLWLWILLGLGAVASGVRRRWPAALGLALAAVYIAAMLVSARAARQIVESRWAETTGSPPPGLMVGPAPIDPFRKTIIIDAGDRYITGAFRWYPRRIAFDASEIPKNDASRWVRHARAQEPDFDAILVWSRFPFWEITEDAGGVRVTLYDARFRGRRGTFSASTVLRRSTD